MKNVKISLTVCISASLMLVACGGGVSVKKEPVASSSETTSATEKLAMAKPTIAKAVKVKPAKAASTNQLNDSGKRFAEAAKAHNRIRSKHSLAPLVWSESLAKYAQDWANQLGDKNCQMEHRPNSGSFKQIHGENLFWAGATTWSDGRREAQGFDINDVVNDWASEVIDYNHANNSCKPGKQCGHFTQVVWKDTKEVGCGFKQCSDKSQLWVCNYSPAGNIIGQKPY